LQTNSLENDRPEQPPRTSDNFNIRISGENSEYVRSPGDNAVVAHAKNPLLTGSITDGEEETERLMVQNSHPKRRRNLDTIT
jgi:hypothetical protein